MTDTLDIEVPLPARLRHLGARTMARLIGDPNGPLVVVLGGISANRDVPAWWPGFIGTGGAVDPERYRILGLDFAADEAGAVAPSTAEQAEILALALDAAGIARAHAIVGASYGGMVALAFAQHWPERVRRLAVISAPASPHPAATAWRELQRRVVAFGLANRRGEEALAIARGMAMLSYRTAEEFEARFAGGIADSDPLATSAPGAYLRARGEAYPAVMSPGRFLSLSASLDRHKIDPAAIAVPVLAIGASSDRLVPPAQMRALAEALPDARLHILDCLFGHDMFLKEADKVGALVRPFLEAP